MIGLSDKSIHISFTYIVIFVVHACVWEYHLIWLWYFFSSIPWTFYPSILFSYFSSSQSDFCLWMRYSFISFIVWLYLFCVRMIFAVWMKFGFLFLWLLWMFECQKLGFIFADWIILRIESMKWNGTLKTKNYYYAWFLYIYKIIEMFTYLFLKISYSLNWSRR